MITSVTSRENKTVKLIRSLHKRKGRDKEGLYFAEGTRLVGEAVEYISDKVRYILVSETYAEKNEYEVNKLDNDGKNVYITDDKIFAEICDTQTPQGIAAVIEKPREDKLGCVDCDYVLILDGVSEPGNMGTIIRTAEAAGVEYICLINNCTDIYSPKVVRSAMGSLFRMKFGKIDISHMGKMKSEGFTVVATALYNSKPIEDIKIKGKRAVVIGSEAHGVSDEVLAVADTAVRLDMGGNVESLNAAVASGIIMYMLKG